MVTAADAIQTYPVGAGRKQARQADAFITRCGAGYKVHSPAAVDGTLGSFLIANLTQDMAMVTLPARVVLAGVGPVDLPSQHVAEFALRSGAGGEHSYSVVMKPAGGGLVTAQGSSDPVIIIDPPNP